MYLSLLIRIHNHAENYDKNVSPANLTNKRDDAERQGNILRTIASNKHNFSKENSKGIKDVVILYLIRFINRQCSMKHKRIQTDSNQVAND